MTLDEALRMPRVAICGGPRVGKTTLALGTGRRVVHTDDYIGTPYEELGSLLRDVCESLTSFVLEGVRAGHALRAGLEVDAAVWLETPHVLRSPQQEVMARGTRTVWNEWLAMDGGKTPTVEQ